MTNEDNTPAPQDKKFLSSAVYDKLKTFTLIWLPAISTLYFTLGNIWGFPNIEQVVGSLAAIGVFLGIVLGISTSRYNSSEAKYDGDVVVTTDKELGTKVFDLRLNGDPYELESKDQIVFKVKSE